MLALQQAALMAKNQRQNQAQALAHTTKLALTRAAVLDMVNMPKEVAQTSYLVLLWPYGLSWPLSFASCALFW